MEMCVNLSLIIPEKKNHTSHKSPLELQKRSRKFHRFAKTQSEINIILDLNLNSNISHEMNPNPVLYLYNLQSSNTSILFMDFNNHLNCFYFSYETATSENFLQAVC